MGNCLPDYIEYVAAKNKLTDEFNMASTHMLLVRSDIPSSDKRAMIGEMEDVDGVKFVLGLESLTGGLLPEEMLPEQILGLLKSGKWELMMISSEYKVASEQVNDQIEALNDILKKYDPDGMLIGEAPCMKDMIETTGHDFKVVNAVSILAIFVIILLVEQSLSLPVILIAVIELAIFINLGLAHFLGQSLPFIAPICISTIQLGATVDYAILMTTRYKNERRAGADTKSAVKTAIASSAPSIIVSGAGLFAATFGVAVYSNIDIIRSMCMLMARGAVISVICVIASLPAMLMAFDRVIRATTLKMKEA
jgi:predicted RND superfamily exporter protein